MKLPLVSLLLALSAAPLLATEQVVTLGDSLTFAYEGEFGFTVNVPLVGPTGDNMPATVRNWAEILGSTSYRNAYFDQGTRDFIHVDFRPFGTQYDLFFRNLYNWAIPGLKVDQLRRFVAGEDGFKTLIGENAEFATIATALNYSDFTEAEDFNWADMNAQITSTAERLVLFIGGNDVRAIYGTVYNGTSAGTFTDDFISDATAILDRVRVLNANIQIVVVAVPHIGITPDIKADFPTDPVKTQRVTALLQDLNSRLKTVAEQHGAGFADVFTTTLSLLQPAPYCIDGITFTNSGSATGDLGFVWLNGKLSANFHPNTNAQAVIANSIVAAFNKRYQTGIAPLSATEILGGLMGKTTTLIDMTFASWMTGFGLTGGTESSDSDGDGITAGVEFALGLNPILRDSDQVTTSVVPIAGGSALQMAYPQRLTAPTHYTLQATSSSNLVAPFSPVTPTLGADGLLRAQIPTSGGKGFMRLTSTLIP